MSETPTENTAPTMSAEDKEKAIASLPDFLQTAVRNLNTSIAEHNKNVAAIQSADKQDPKLIKAEIFETQYEQNDKLTKLRKAYVQAAEQMERIVKQAYEVIEKDGLMPQELDEKAVEKLKSDVAESGKTLKAKVGALIQMEEMVPEYKGKLESLLVEMKTRRGTAKSSGGTSSQSGIKRPRFKRIEINGQIEDDKGNKVFGTDPKTGDPKFTFTFAANYLRKMHKGIDWTQTELGEKYFEGLDENNLPDEHTFVMPYTYKDENGHEQTVNYEIKTIR